MKNCYLLQELAIYQLSVSEWVCCAGRAGFGEVCTGEEGSKEGVPSVSEEKSNSAVGAGTKLSQRPENGYVKTVTRKSKLALNRKEKR